MKQNTPCYLFGMYEPDTNSVIVNANNDTYTGTPLTISCEKCNSADIDTPDDIAYLYRLAQESPLLYAELACKPNKHFSSHSWKGGEIMKPSDFQKTIQCQFESKLKKVVKGIVKNYQKELKRRKKNEIPFCEFPEIIVEKFTVWDDYETDYTIFNVSLIAPAYF